MTAVARLTGVGLRYGGTQALAGIDLEVPAGIMVGLIGPDGVGKSSLLALLAGARQIQAGRIEVLGGDMARAAHRDEVGPRIAYMPQGLGRNLYPLLSVEENLQFFARLFGHDEGERRRRIDELTRATGLDPFLSRPAGKLSGGMKQKLGLCCSLIHDPDLLILDEPTTGVDPLARRQFWDLIERIRSQRPGMSVLVATAYMDEAARFDWLVAMDGGRVLATGSPAEIYARTGTDSLEGAFIALLPESERRGHVPVVIPPLAPGDGKVAIEARDLTMRFGEFTAVDRVTFQIREGEIFGFLGSNGCGKSTTMKMLTGLLQPAAGEARLFGRPVDASDLATRQLVGYMSQAFSLYTELTVRQNLMLHARLFGVAEGEIAGRVMEMVERFGLGEVQDALPESLPLGIRQRLSLAVAMVHRPRLLILDEPTSGVDPVARDNFWRFMVDLARRDKVTIFISTHFMNEGARCDRISLMHGGRVLAADTPAALARNRGAANLEDAFISYLEEAGAMASDGPVPAAAPAAEVRPRPAPAGHRWFSPGRLWSYALREALELQRDPVRATLALLGSVILMFIMGYGISLDVENLRFAVLDRDQTTTSEGYAGDLGGSRYLIARPPLADYEELDRRMRTGEVSLAIEIPPGMARDAQRGKPVEIAAWVDGAMPLRAETIEGYAQGMHQTWLLDQVVRERGYRPRSAASVETRFRYNPDVRSLPAIVPAVVPILLLVLPAMLSVLSVVREKELGSILNLYVTPVTRLEFLLGKQLPYVAIAMLNFAAMTALAATVFGVPVKGSLLTLAAAALVFCVFSTGFGMLASTFTSTQVAGMFVALIGTIIPAVQFAGMIHPVSSLEGMGRWIGEVYPTTYMLTISRGVFSKALGFMELRSLFLPMVAADVVIVAAAVALLRKQER